MIDKISKEYEGEWEISTPAYSDVFKNIVTPTFSPLPDNSITFRFEAWYQQVSHPHNSADLSLFKLKLVRLSSVPVSSTLEVVVNVRVNYSDGSLFKDYPTLPPTKVDAMSVITFGDVIKELHTVDLSCSTHFSKMQSKTLIIKCKMIFYDYNQTVHFMSGFEKLSSSTYCDLIRNFKAMYDPAIFSDFAFKIGDKTLPAHKVVLSAHSPVFKKMMSLEFLEKKTNSVTVTDTTFEVFDMFLRYLYSGEIGDKSWDSLKALYHLADKYDVGVLKNECTDEAISVLSVNLVCDILQVAYSYSDLRLKTAAKQFAIQNMKEIVLREDWKELVTNHPIIGYELTVEFFSKYV